MPCPCGCQLFVVVKFVVALPGGLGSLIVIFCVGFASEAWIVITAWLVHEGESTVTVGDGLTLPAAPLSVTV